MIINLHNPRYSTLQPAYSVLPSHNMAASQLPWKRQSCKTKFLQPQNIKITNRFITLKIKNHHHHHQLQNVVQIISNIFSGGTGKRQSAERYFDNIC